MYGNGVWTGTATVIIQAAHRIIPEVPLSVVLALCEEAPGAIIATATSYLPPAEVGLHPIIVTIMAVSGLLFSVKVLPDGKSFTGIYS